MAIEFHYGIKLVKALSNDVRMEMIRILSCGDRCLAELEQLFPGPKETLEQHLEILADVKLVEKRTVNYLTFYAIDPSSKNIIRNLVTNTRCAV